MEYIKDKLVGWPLLKLYYAGFFAAHAIMRATGESVSRFEEAQTKTLNDLISLYLTPAFNFHSGTFHTSIVQHKDTSIDVIIEKASDDSRGGAHGQFWKIFLAYLAKVQQSVTDSKEMQSTAVSVIITELTTLLKAQSSTNGNWLSTMRNSINYQHEFQVWFPGDSKSVAHEALEGATLKDTASVRLDINTKKEPLRAFINGAQYITLVSFDLAETFSNRSKNQYHFQNRWSRLRKALNDGK